MAPLFLTLILSAPSDFTVCVLAETALSCTSLIFCIISFISYLVTKKMEYNFFFETDGLDSSYMFFKKLPENTEKRKFDEGDNTVSYNEEYVSGLSQPCVKMGQTGLYVGQSVGRTSRRLVGYDRLLSRCRGSGHRAGLHRAVGTQVV